MKKHILFYSIALIFLAGCQQRTVEHQYIEDVQVASTHQAKMMHQMSQLPEGHPPIATDPKEDPHAGLGIPLVSSMEKSQGSVMGGMDPSMVPAANPTNSSSLTWIVPDGWEFLGSTSMRLATFKVKGDANQIDCSIISLGGMAGGLEANIERWLGQINVSLAPQDLKMFIEKSTDNIFDFTKLQSNASSSSKSMMAAMLSINNATVFVKMTGSIENISKNKENFFKLVKSVRAQ